jgi:hypothetical protein
VMGRPVRRASKAKRNAPKFDSGFSSAVAVDGEDVGEQLCSPPRPNLAAVGRRTGPFRRTQSARVRR